MNHGEFAVGPFPVPPVLSSVDVVFCVCVGWPSIPAALPTEEPVLSPDCRSIRFSFSTRRSVRSS